MTATDLRGLASGVGLSAEVGGSGASLGEVAREDGLEQRAEDHLGTTAACKLEFHVYARKNLRSLGESHPEDEDELEGVVEGYWSQSCAARDDSGALTEPVAGADGALENGQEGKCYPVLCD